MARSIQAGSRGGYMMAAAIACTAVSLLPATSRADDTWNPAHEHAAFVRNNTTSDFTIQQISKTSSTSGCTVSGSDYFFTSGTSNVPVGGGSMVEVLNVEDTISGGDNDHCLKSGNVWRLVLARNGCSATHSIDIKGNGSLAADGGASTGASSDVSLNFCGATHTVNLFGRSSFHESGVYVTIGTDEHGELGPSRDAANVHDLSVTSYNTFLGTDSKPERCERAELMASALPGLDTDVLVLQEMNLREADCYDGLELATYLWTGSTNDDYIENDSYACSASGTGQSPNGNSKDASVNGAFPFISQFASGIAVNGNESYTGGVVILSKYPVTMIENRTYAVGPAEEKGFIVVKITKTHGAAHQDYYIVATHTSADSDLDDQLDELADYLNDTTDIPVGARVILAGDLNTNGQAGQLEALGVDIGYDSVTGTHDHQTNAGFYPYSRDSSVDFYHQNESAETIDWVQPISEATSGHDHADPFAFNWHVFPVRDTSFKFADLSDHFAVTARFEY